MPTRLATRIGSRRGTTFPRPDQGKVDRVTVDCENTVAGNGVGKGTSP